MQREELVADDGIDKQPVRVRTGRMFLDGFAGIKQGQANLDLPIFAAMSPTDQVCQQCGSLARHENTMLLDGCVAVRQAQPALQPNSLQR